VAVLRRELHNVQKLMMSNLPDPDFESNILEENARLRQEVRSLKESSAQSSSQEIETLRQQLTEAREKGAKFENAEIENLRLELKRVRQEYEDRESAMVEQLRQELSGANARASEVETESVKKISNELELAGKEISDLKSKLDDCERKFAESEEKLSKVFREISALCSYRMDRLFSLLW